jgi:hypothetical protein
MGALHEYMLSKFYYNNSSKIYECIAFLTAAMALSICI